MIRMLTITTMGQKMHSVHRLSTAQREHKARIEYRVCCLDSLDSSVCVSVCV